MDPRELCHISRESYVGYVKKKEKEREHWGPVHFLRWLL